MLNADEIDKYLNLKAGRDSMLPGATRLVMPHPGKNEKYRLACANYPIWREFVGLDGES